MIKKKRIGCVQPACGVEEFMAWPRNLLGD